MEQYIQYAKGMNASEDLIIWLERRLKRVKNATTVEIEHVIDFCVSPDAPPKLHKMSWKDTLHCAHRWVEKLRKQGEQVQEEESDIETVLDFGDGFKFVKLIGQNAYEREGHLMRHCVSSYYGRDVEVYSLRDPKNMPHCTVEKDVQIKGKGNGDIHPKYIDYVVRFLEHTGMDVRDSEMLNLGYEIVKFSKYATTPLYRGKYAPKGSVISYRNDVTIVYSQEHVSAYRGIGVLLLDANLEVRQGATFEAPALAEVSGYVDVRQGATFEAPALAKSGSVYVWQGATFEVPALAKSGSVDVRQGATFEAPALAKSGYVDVRQGATFEAPALAKSGSVYVRQGATFEAPALAEVSGYVEVQQGATFEAPALAKSGSVDVRQGATFEAPALAKSGSVDVWQGATFEAPALAKSGYVEVQQGATFEAPALAKSGSVYVWQGATFEVPALAEVSGAVYVWQGATFEAPALAEVSGYVEVQQGATFEAPLLNRNAS